MDSYGGYRYRVMSWYKAFKERQIIVESKKNEDGSII